MDTVDVITLQCRMLVDVETFDLDFSANRNSCLDNYLYKDFTCLTAVRVVRVVGSQACPIVSWWCSARQARRRPGPGTTTGTSCAGMPRASCSTRVRGLSGRCCSRGS